MRREQIAPVLLPVLQREGVAPEALTVLIRDMETGRRFFTDGVRRRGYQLLGVTPDGGGWCWLSAGMVMEVKE